MSVVIVPMLLRHARGFHAALDSVAREGRYLAMVEAPPLSTVRRFVRNGIASGSVQFVALVEGRVVGWCDVARLAWITQRHSGTLGLGVVAEHRGRRLGRALLAATLARTDEVGIDRVELRVRTDNEPAIRLYRSCGFEIEGRCRDYLRVSNGERHDVWLMARLVPGSNLVNLAGR
jgi:RimJ/RimL family protein N-acetyltransferase